MQVFGIHLAASVGVTEPEFLHVGSVLAGFLDNDGDSNVDNAGVVYSIRKQTPVILVTRDRAELERMLNQAPASFVHKVECGRFVLEPFFATGIRVDYRTATARREDGSWGTVFDETLREMFVFIAKYGYSKAYPQRFGLDPGAPQAEPSLLGAAMDRARGGRFVVVPTQYPKAAWYHDLRQTSGCTYQCQAANYLWYLVGAQLGAHDYGSRCADLQALWELCTREQVRRAHTPTRMHATGRVRCWA